MAASKISSKICRSSRPKSSTSSSPTSTSEKPADTTSQINRGLTLNHLVICGCLAIISMASVTMAKPPDQEAIHHKNGKFQTLCVSLCVCDLISWL